ncbi:MAG: hypothetical protein AAFZ01_01545 [Pseudomonadota bacterium]
MSQEAPVSNRLAYQPSRFARCWPATLYLIICGIIPVSLLFYEYGSTGWTIIRLYGALFIYPLLFGWISIALITGPYLFMSRGIGDHRSVFRATAFGAFVVALGLLGLELIVSKNIAPYEIKPELAAATSIDNTSLLGYFDAQHGGDRSMADCNADAENVKCRFQGAMNLLLGNSYIPTDSWSKTRYAYIASFLVQAFTLIFCFMVYGMFIALRYRRKITSENEDAYFTHVYYAIGSIAVALLWLLFRVANSYEKAYFYPSESLYVADIAIALMYSIAIGLLAISLWLRFGKEVLALLAAFWGAGGLFAIFKWPDVVAEAFGRDNILVSCAIIGLVVFAVTYVIFIIRRFSDVDEADAA